MKLAGYLASSETLELIGPMFRSLSRDFPALTVQNKPDLDYARTQTGEYPKPHISTYAHLHQLGYSLRIVRYG